jgi:hypothetical protein
MSSSDKSASASTRQLRNRALANYYAANPGAHESGRNATFGGGAHTARVVGQYAFTVQGALKPNQVDDGCCGGTVAAAPSSCPPPGGITNFQITSSGYAPDPPYNDSTDWRYALSWDPVPGATSYVITLDAAQTVLSLTYPTATTAIVIFTTNFGTVTITLTALNSCGSSTSSLDDMPCFLEGSLVTMADYSTKPIELVCVGDLVLGAFGEPNAVLALHRPRLGEAKMCRINDEHSTTNHHPHIGADRQFYCGDPTTVSTQTYGREHDVLLADGVPGRMFLHGLQRDRILQLHCGVELKTVEGSRSVRSLEVYEMPPETQLYNLVVGGSHTYHVEGYAVTGWPREDDFDYDAWAPIA